VDGSVKNAEWAGSQNYTFKSPKAGDSSFRLGFYQKDEQMAVGMKLADGSNQDDDNVTVLIAQRSVGKDAEITTGELKLEIERDGSWELSRANSQGNWSRDSSGDEPSDTDEDELEFAVQRSGSTCTVEALIETSRLEEDDDFSMAIMQADNGKTSSRGSLDHKKPSDWEEGTLPGRLPVTKLRAVPSTMEAGIGGHVAVTSPADATKGLLRLEVKTPGSKTFDTEDRIDPASKGDNRFEFVPRATGTYEMRACWAGHKEYTNTTTDAREVEVTEPGLDNRTVPKAGGIRATFPIEADRSPAQWRYFNAELRASDGSGNTLDLRHPLQAQDVSLRSLDGPSQPRRRDPRAHVRSPDRARRPRARLGQGRVRRPLASPRRRGLGP